LKLSVKLYQIISIVFFLCIATVSDALIVHSAIEFNMKVHEPQNVFYWLNPVLAPIQAGNTVLLLGGIGSGLVGALIPSVTDKPFKNVLRILLPVILSIELVAVSILSNMIYQWAIIGYHPVNIPNLPIHEFKMFLGMMLYFLFWIYVGQGIRLTTSPLFSSLVVAGIQVAELFVIYPHNQVIAQYLPTGLSRELVVSHFQYWQPGSWSFNPNVVHFASTSVLINSNHEFLNPSFSRLYGSLLMYILICYMYPIARNILHNKVVQPEVPSNAQRD
jgi:hypothetical protein